MLSIGLGKMAYEWYLERVVLILRTRLDRNARNLEQELIAAHSH